MPVDLIMPRWAVVGAEVSQMRYYNGPGPGSPYSEGRCGKITRVLKTQVEVEFPLYRQDDPDAKVLTKFKLCRGYRPLKAGDVRVDTLEEMGSKWNNGVIWPTNGKRLAELRVAKEILQTTNKMQVIASAFSKKNAYHVGLADGVTLIEELQAVLEDRKLLEEKLLEVDEMPQDR